MKTILAFVLAFVATAANANRLEEIFNMNAQCECYMVGGVCRVANDSKPLVPGSVKWTSSGPIPAEVYEKYRTDPQMCAKGVQACTKDWNGQDCRLGFRKMFRKTPITCVRPGVALPRKE
jgi:hypothetical protein